MGSDRLGDYKSAQNIELFCSQGSDKSRYAPYVWKFVHGWKYD